ncbi:hypothetical protein WR25_14263 [Diploscapter pachys]|uniref:Probable deoxycytidylate deaminase n=1 Tax=Diploscapter pachys TaxID=2018661 RepID=A0A2A2KD61_9BILA|nr:hypothetical protein WR25_14263 [Diploscapter pachys]
MKNGAENLCRILENAKLNPENVKRDDYISWEEYFMAVTIATSHRSKDPATQVGCVLVNEDNHIVGAGYNGFPNGISDDEYPWGKQSENPLETKYTYVVHAEMNAIMNATARQLKNCRLYTTRFPCNECAKLVIQARIGEIIYLDDKEEQWQSQAARKMFNTARIPTRKYQKTGRKIVIEL